METRCVTAFCATGRKVLRDKKLLLMIVLETTLIWEDWSWSTICIERSWWF